MTGGDQLRVRLLGGLAVEGVPVLSLGSRKARAVLRRLALAPDGWVSADALVEAAWPEGAPVRAADQLAVLVSRLRGVLGADRLPKHPAGYGLRADWVDTLALREHVAAAESSLDPREALEHGRAAVVLLTGPLLPEDDSEPVAEERAAVEVLAARARLVTARAALAAGSPWEALEVASRAREEDPYDEAALRLVLAALSATSRPSAAVSTYLEAARRLREELGTDPEPATQQVYLDLLRETPPEPVVATESSLAGRDQELASLSRAWRAAIDGTPALVIVEGPPGIGKSTLLRAFADQVADEAWVLRAAPDAVGAELPLQPILDALGTALAQGDGDALLGADRELLAPLLGRAPAPVSTASAFAAVSTGTGRALLLGGLAGLLARMGAARPVLLMLDDAHLADETTVQLLHRCTRDGAGHRLLAVCARRPAEGPTWVGSPLVVPGLDEAAVAQLVGPERAADLWARSAGHPLFVHELARYDGDDAPPSVLAAVAARCAGTDEVAETLRAAAVLGAPDDVDLLAAVLETPPAQVLERLEAGVRQAVLREDARGFAFAHQMFQEAFAGGVGPTRAATLHRAAAQVLASRPGSDPLRVARHATLGGDEPLAATSLTTAAERASHRYEHAEAAALLDRAVALADSTERRLARARVLLALGRYGDAESDADEALAGGAGAAGLEVAALVSYFERDLDRALELADEAAATATDPELVAGCRCLAGRVLLTIGRLEEAENRLSEAADVATGTMRAVTSVWQANLAAMRDEGGPAYRLARGATAATVRHDPTVEPYRAMAMGRALATLGRPFEALQSFDHLAEVVERQQVSRFAGRADNFRSWVLRNLGASKPAEELTQRAWDAVGEVRDLAHAEAHCHAALDLADTALRIGDPDGAATWLDRMEAAPLTPHVMRWRIELRARLLRGRQALLADDPEFAGRLADEVHAEALRLGVPKFVSQARVLQAQVGVRTGEPHNGLDSLAEELVRTAPLESWWLLAELATSTGDAHVRALAEQQVVALVAGAGPWADALRAAADQALGSAG